MFVNSLAVMVLSYWCALSDERSGLSFVSLKSKVYSLCQYIQGFLQFYIFNMEFYYTIYTRPLSIQARYSRLCPTSCG
jgi:hypothetical protein